MDKDFFAHPTAIVDSEKIGSGTRIWAYAHVLNGAEIGENCNIGDHCFVESHVKIGNDVVIKNGVSVWDEVNIGDLVFVGPNVVFTNDMFPRSKVFHEKYVPTHIHKGVSIGANATIICGNTIHEYAMIGAGSVVTRDVAAYALVVGNPAHHIGYVCQCGTRLLFSSRQAHCAECGKEYIESNNVVKIITSEQA
ncbi:N-acetyltransferase [candidate division KSB1 bacterium]|nr:N-acetyltransferase [candidate division KSB1 bacterium]